MGFLSPKDVIIFQYFVFICLISGKEKFGLNILSWKLDIHVHLAKSEDSHLAFISYYFLSNLLLYYNFLSYQTPNPIFLGLRTKYFQYHEKLPLEEVQWNVTDASYSRDNYFSFGKHCSVILSPKTLHIFWTPRWLKVGDFYCVLRQSRLFPIIVEMMILYYCTLYIVCISDEAYLFFHCFYSYDTSILMGSS